MNILVTGGAGYIGSHVCKELSLAGHLPICFDDLSTGHEAAVKWGPLVQADIADKDQVKECINRYRPEAILHLAASAYVEESTKNPGKYYRNNVAGTLALIECARDTGIDKLIFSSSCAVYGNPSQLPVHEHHKQNPISPYGASKQMIERMLADFDAAHGIRSIALRFFNAAGADPGSELSEQHDPETHLIPLVLDVAEGIRSKITINGNRYETPDGTCVRDYVHVNDLAAAHVLALKSLDAGASSAAFNLGNGKGFSVREIINAAEAVTGRRIRTELGPERTGDPPSLSSNSTLARQKLGWVPRYPEIEDMIEHAWRARCAF